METSSPLPASFFFTGAPAPDAPAPDAPAPATESSSTSASADTLSGPMVPAASRNASTPVPTRIRRRNRMITSCLECRRRKLKCDKSHPCVNCTKARRECVFLSPALDQASQLKLTQIKEKVGSLERLLERDVARSAAAAAAATGHAPSGAQSDEALPDDADDDLPGAEDETGLEPTPLAVGDAVYDDDADTANDDLLDLGIQMGKMRITERIGGFFRPRISEELQHTLSNEPGPDERLGLSPYAGDESIAQSPHEYLKAGQSYIAPASGFLFGQAAGPTSLIDFLPSRLAADRLVKQYFAAVHPIAKVLHRPTFEAENEAFWEEVALGIEPPSSVQCVVFATMFSGVVSMDETTVWRDFGVSKERLIDNFRLGTETALGRANFLRTTKVETLQAFVMYLIPLCRDEVSRAHSILVGAAIRMAECMGLHRDGESYGLNPLETHVRRLIWHQLCFLDIRTCEAQGPRPTIHKDDFDTKLPLNVDDADLHASGKPPSAKNVWTDATFALIRFEINEMMRTIWVDRPRIERRKISLTAVLSKIETFRRNMAAKYDHIIDERIPLQRCAKMVKSLLQARLHVMTLHRYHNSVSSTMPERLRQIMLNSGTTLLENAVALEIIPEVQRWKWYAGAYNQYHAAFLLLIEVFFYPERKEADRIWPCLDYVFETDRAATREVKARQILKELQKRTAVYQEMRKMRGPSSMNKFVGQRLPKKPEQAAKVPAGAGLGYDTTAIGRAPVPDVVFAGVSNGETLWAMPNPQSPEGGSDVSSVLGPMPSMPGDTFPAQVQFKADDLMADIDWDAFDQLFPPDIVMGDLAGQPFDLFNPGVY